MLLIQCLRFPNGPLFSVWQILLVTDPAIAPSLHSHNPHFLLVTPDIQHQGRNQGRPKPAWHPLLLSANCWWSCGHETQFWQMKCKGKFLEVTEELLGKVSFPNNKEEQRRSPFFLLLLPSCFRCTHTKGDTCRCCGHNGKTSKLQSCRTYPGNTDSRLLVKWDNKWLCRLSPCFSKGGPCPAACRQSGLPAHNEVSTEIESKHSETS